MQISENIKNQILSIIFNYLNKDHCTIFLFGSYSQNTAKQSSDIDIGIISTDSLTLSLILSIKEALNENVSILRDIEVVNFSDKNLDKDFIRIALRNYKIWHMTKESSEILNNLIKHI